VPVPLHPARLRARRYNQAGLLARAVGRASGVAVLLDALVRIRPTQPLGEMSAEQRAQAVEGVFAIRRGRSVMLSGKRIVLVDDVLTSGATATGCTQALLAAGAQSVDVLVAARVPDPRRR
jgi:predicted amidophosphoribosyltransferase